ncbi:MAG: prolipoprotein diacylglyceryl transferase [Candidatus Doudnabacteria bacterium]|nr:prolipoprotein diacylglyceryl transferase [Candidatus Doudnabacteria bacterium]
MAKRNIFLIVIAGLFYAGLLVYFGVAKNTGPGPGLFIGPLFLRFYSVMFFFGVLFAWLAAKALRERFGLSENDLDNLVMVCIIAGLFGARIHHVLSEWEFYRGHLYEIFSLWKGGLGFYGGLAGAGMGVWVYARIKTLNFFSVAGLLACVLPLGQAFGRWGNFFNSEAYGQPTGLPWGMFVSPEYRLPEFGSFSYFHPLFLYESFYNLVVFAVLLLALKRAKFSRLFLLPGYLVLYPLGRFWLEGLRLAPTMIFGVPLNQLLSLLVIALGLFLLVHFVRSLARSRPSRHSWTSDF